MKTEANDPAYPESIVTLPDGRIQLGSSGLTKREYFAAMAMQALLANPKIGDEISSDVISAMATDQADDLIKELNDENLV